MTAAIAACSTKNWDGFITGIGFSGGNTQGEEFLAAVVVVVVGCNIRTRLAATFHAPWTHLEMGPDFSPACVACHPTAFSRHMTPAKAG